MDSDTVIHGNNLTIMAGFADNTFDTVITDPPYGLRFMGKKWDYDIPSVAHFAEMLRVAKPGAILLSFGGTRTFHRIACNIEDAGWNIVDCVMWIYGQGFPKATDISKMIDKSKGLEREVVGKNPNARETLGNIQICKKNGTGTITAPASPEAALWNGYKTALKPAWEPVIVAMKPLDGTYANNALKWGVAGFNIDGCRIMIDDITKEPNYRPHAKENKGHGSSFGCQDLDRDKSDLPDEGFHNSQGRFPANLIHDGSEEVLAEFPMTGVSKGGQSGVKKSGLTYSASWDEKQNSDGCGFGDSGTAARFFYCAKSSKREREMGLLGYIPCVKCGGIDTTTHIDDKGNTVPCCRNNHPTVKTINLMRYLVKLTATPTGGVVLDPYGGSGTTGMACKLEGRNFVLIEQDEKYCEIARRRIEACQAGSEGLFTD